MNATVVDRAGAKADILPPLPGKLRALLTAVVLWLGVVPGAGAWAVPGTGPVEGPGTRATASAKASVVQWRFEDDAFADLWFHGLAVVGYYGFGPMPLYDPGYVLGLSGTLPSGEPGAGGPTPLSRDRAAFLQAFQADDAFEVLHFVPLYFHGAGRDAALSALRRIAQAPSGVPPARDPETALGVQIVAQVLARPDQRRILRSFVAALEQEWRLVVEPARRAQARKRDATLRALAARWREAWAPALGSFLAAEDLTRGVALVADALGAEGRFVPPSPDLGRDAVAGLTLPEGPEAESADAVLASLVRELCFPAVRRAMEPLEARLQDRVEASRVSDLSATRCGEMLLEASAPDLLAVYRTRFGIDPARAGAGFLSASGLSPEAAVVEEELEHALRRELDIH